MFVEEFKYSGIVKCKQDIEDVMREIRDHRREIRLALRLPALDYSTVLGTEVCKKKIKLQYACFRVLRKITFRIWFVVVSFRAETHPSSTGTKGLDKDK